MSRGETVLRVERGQADETELAALAAVLLAFSRAREGADDGPADTGSSWWRRPEGFVPPGSWR
jgi:hypothetical protein